MKPSKSTSSHHSQYIDEALSSSRTDILRVQILDEGRIGAISQQFLIAGIVGLSRRSIAVIGIANRGNRLEVQNIDLSDEVLEDFLRAQLGPCPGVKDVQYSRQVVGAGICYVVEIAWESGMADAVSKALGANFRRRSWSRVFDQYPRGPAHGFWRSSLERYIKYRRAIDPDAVELRFTPDELPALLGFVRDRGADGTEGAAMAGERGI